MSACANSTSRSKESIVEHILEQGQRLRNAMVKAILDADPFYKDENVLKPQTENKGQQGSCHVCNKTKGSTPSCCHSFFNYHGCSKSCNIKTAHRDISTSTDESLLLALPTDDITSSIQDSYRSKSISYFKYVNSLKVVLHCLVLNQAGNRKVNATTVDSKYKLPTSVSHNYFVEFSLPETLGIGQHVRNGQSKVDSGLDSSHFRVCSKKIEEQEIHLKHTSVHDIKNLLYMDLQNIEIVFQVSCRTLKQKNTNIIGYGKFNMGSFEITKNLTCNQDIPIIDDQGLCFGSLKLSLQLGCGRLYFGKELVDFINTNMCVESVHNNTNRISNSPVQVESTENKTKKIESDFKNQLLPQSKVSSGHNSDSSLNFDNKIHNVKRSGNDKPPANTLDSATNSKIKENAQEVLLFGLIYISEVQYFNKVSDTYLSCQVFSQGDTVCSRVVYNNKHPIFNFYQKAPYLLDDAFLSGLRDNSLRVDFWERNKEEDVVFGSTQLSLYQFYTSYKNRTIVESIIHNKLPVTVSDWWEPISSEVEGTLCGQVKILVSLGTASQIENLEIERGIKELSNKVKYIPTGPVTKIQEKPKEPLKKPELFRRPNYLKSNKIDTHKKIDVGIQSDLDDMESQKPDKSSIQNMLETFLTQLQNQKTQNTCMENSTNTDIPIEHKEVTKNLGLATESLLKLNDCRNATNMHLQKTSDLLDHLNDALSGESRILFNKVTTRAHLNEEQLVESKTLLTKAATSMVPDVKSFKARIVIDSALHLPTRRNYKSRKTKKRYNEVPPSAYVTFETVLPSDVKITPVVSKSCSPTWNYVADVSLPFELLNNSQKRLIFKVWSRSTNSSLPNLQSDIVLGFAALDLTVLESGLPSVQGWFNIIDFTSKCNGQIKIDVTPLENLKNAYIPPISVHNVCDTEPKETLNRALKRKFTQLDEITQRLRARLADVTKDDSDLSNDAFADEFERDINTTSEENDHNMIDLASSCDSSSSTAKAELHTNQFILPADRELLQGKQRIDMLLEKLSLLANHEMDRYVSGCSIQQNCEEVVKQTDAGGNHLHLTEISSIPSLTELSDISSKTVAKISDSNASSSILSARFPIHRHAPDGAGNSILDDSEDS